MMRGEVWYGSMPRGLPGSAYLSRLQAAGVVESRSLVVLR